ncbi:peptidase [Falsiroseomonas bella]|uniref:Peptidase n=1 Tax=Falsiroseomonas bella TaxID=2184016 RepID=A0A317F9S6_9PROT|nr:M48 family metalloprotease [Falsiroseomonas bella]PWS35880.1 peptidase [Falsiroseomonas bella]
MCFGAPHGPGCAIGRRSLLVATAFAAGVVSAPDAAAQVAPRQIVTIRDAETENLLRRMAYPLMQAAGVDPATVPMTLIRNGAVNAFVAQGNFLYLYTGLIQQAESAGEVAGVLAHEIGHVMGGHLARLPEQMRNAMLRSLGAMLLGGAAAAASGEPGAMAAGMLGGQAMATNEFTAFTRTQEQSADQAALDLLDQVGWSARGLERLLERTVDKEQLVAGRQDPYFRTHPLSRDRLDFVRQRAGRSRVAGAGMPAGIERSFVMVRAKLDGFIEPHAAVMRRYPASDTSAPARYARAIGTFRAGRIDQALAMLRPLAAEAPSDPWLQELTGQVLLQGQRPTEAARRYAEAVRLAPAEPLIRIGHARALGEIGNPAQLRLAASELETALRSERRSAFAWRQLAVVRGRLGETALADLALAEEALILQDARQAAALARRAEAGLPAGAPRLRAQDIVAAAENLPARRRRW